jgi:apolipoprotein N-acyltransferase
MIRRILASIGPGLLITAGLPPWGWWPLSLIGLAIWYRRLTGQPTRTRFRISVLVGLGWSAPATIWMADFSLAGWPAAVLVFSLCAGAVGVLTPPERRWAQRIAFPAALMLIEMVRWNYPFGGTPIASYAMIGMSTPWAEAARLFGSPLLAGLVGLAGVGVADLRERQARRAAGIAAVLLVASLSGQASLATTTVVGTLDVAVVQGGGPQNTRAKICENRNVFERHMAASQTIDRPVDLVLWPEDVVHPAAGSLLEPANCKQELLSLDEATSRLTELAQNLDAVVVSGWFRRNDDDLSNSNYSIAQSPDGTITDRYEKVRLVPFGEYVPLRSLIEKFSNLLPARDVRPGTTPAVLDTAVGPLGVAISWEVFFDHRARDAIGNGGQLLLNPTNGSSYWLTVVQTQQIASSRLRAVETGRWVLQAAPTGFSAVIEPDGTVRQRTAVSETAVLYDTVELRTGRTPAVALGAWPALTLALIVLAVAWRHRLRRTQLPA